MELVAVLIAHSTLSVFFQTFFLHRYASHRMFTMSTRWERIFHVLTYVTQGSSYLVPRAYAILHRMHHAYSDTPKDPHSPRYYAEPVSMMLSTAKRYDAICDGTAEVEPRFLGGYPEWPTLDRIGNSWVSRLAWGTGYALFYIAFATQWWQFLFVPLHWTMGPLHGAIVNWCGHRYGYRNFNSDDDSRNTLVLDIVTLGELFQNNHHKYSQSPSFAVRWFEIDPAYQVIRVLAWVGILQMPEKRQVARLDTGTAGVEG
ncbi:acyl-CoA desaturase [Sorangium sp. So ce1014]|uniref:acyl-CoA desaturase n=1 Tax=Sorangium sp. So ce1014 TaxID=3133326 RepID=UPI003F621584